MAFYADEVAEVVHCPALKPWPGEHQMIDGFFNLEGSWLPVLPLHFFLRQPVTALGNFDPLIVSSGHPRIAIRVDQVEKIEKVHWDVIKPWESTVVQEFSMAARIEDPDEPAWLLSLPQLLTSREQELTQKLQELIVERDIAASKELQNMSKESPLS